jgi:hypothetical protein
MKPQTPGVAWLAGLACLLIIPFLTSCKKDKTDPAKNGLLVVHFDNVVGGSVSGGEPLDLTLHTGRYLNAAGDTFSVNRIQYYISNFSFKKEDGTYFTAPPDSGYFLVRENNLDSQDCITWNMPPGNYVGMSFLVGVDSARCTLPAVHRLGVLDENDTATGGSMYWGPSDGYAHLRVEGISSSVPGTNKDWSFQVAGYGNKSASAIMNNARRITLSFPAAAIVADGRNPEAHTFVDVLKLLNGPGGKVSFATVHSVHSLEPASVELANNFAQAFVVGHIHND